MKMRRIVWNDILLLLIFFVTLHFNRCEARDIRLMIEILLKRLY